MKFGDDDFDSKKIGPFSILLAVHIQLSVFFIVDDNQLWSGKNRQEVTIIEFPSIGNGLKVRIVLLQASAENVKVKTLVVTLRYVRKVGWRRTRIHGVGVDFVSDLVLLKRMNVEFQVQYTS